MTAAVTAWGQTPAAPEFEAAAVRVSKPDSNAPETTLITNPRGGGAPAEVLIYPDGNVSRQPVFAPSGTVTLRYVTLRQLITQAYIKEITRDEYLTGGPGWLDSDRFDLMAKAPPGTSIETERLMIQKLLANRFHLALHREQRSLPVYALVVGKKGLKLKPAAGSGTPACKIAADFSRDDKPALEEQGQRGWVCTNMTMTELSNQLPRLALGTIDRLLIDKTGIQGAYDFQLGWRVPALGPDAPRAVTPAQQVDQRLAMFAALDQQLGLRVEEQKQPVPVIVIDRVDRVPAGN
jgi:uncharacterized protein (TIGR03435 family)